jgi:cytidylate kinase
LRLAEALGYIFFDTGGSVSCHHLLALEREIDIHDEAVVTACAEETQIRCRAWLPDPMDAPVMSWSMA